MTSNEDVHGDVGTDGDLFATDCRWEGGERQRPAETVVETVAEATGREPEELSPLFEVVDPDALDALFERNAIRTGGSVDGFVSFEFEGCDVRVGAGGRTVVVPPDVDRA